MPIDLTVHYSDVERIVRSKFAMCNLPLDDVVQEVFLALAKKNLKTSASYDPRRAAISSYIFLVAHSTVLNMLRKQRRMRPELMAAPVSALLADEREWSRADVMCAAIDHYLTTSPTRQRLFRLAREGTPVHDIATTMGWSVTKTRRAIRDMMAAVRLAFAESV